MSKRRPQQLSLVDMLRKRAKRYVDVLGDGFFFKETFEFDFVFTIMSLMWMSAIKITTVGHINMGIPDSIPICSILVIRRSAMFDHAFAH